MINSDIKEIEVTGGWAKKNHAGIWKPVDVRK